MFNKIYYLIKNFVLSFLFIYAYDALLYPLNGIIPINIFNIVFVTLFGVPGMIGLILLFFLF